MNRNGAYALGGLATGMVFMGLIVWFAMPSVMVVKHRSGQSYDRTVAALTEAIARKQGWRVLTVNDYQKSTASFGTIEHVGSMNICNPRYASKVLADDRDRGVTAFMPLAIGVYEDKKGDVYIATLNFGLLGRMFGGTIAEVMGEKAGKDIDDVIATVAAR